VLFLEATPTPTSGVPTPNDIRYNQFLCPSPNSNSDLSQVTLTCLLP
jgi:hypothetical protein